MARRDIIAIGGSLGAIDAVRGLLMDLPADFAATLCIVIHVGAEGRNLLASILGAAASIPVSTASEGEALQPGHAYVAASDRHLLVVDGVIRLGRGPRENMTRPAIDPTFRSVAVNYGPRVIAVVLTGLLNDGAAGLADVKRCGGITVVQSPSDAEAPDMPLGALQASDVDYRAPLAGLPELLMSLSEEEAGEPKVVAPDIILEVQIALGREPGMDMTSKIAQPVALSCPSCGGVLSEVTRRPLRFRCQVGHAFTAEALAAEQEDSVDDAVRVALRIIKERVTLSEKMADDASRTGRPAAAAACEARAEEGRRYTRILQRAIMER